MIASRRSVWMMVLATMALLLMMAVWAAPLLWALITALKPELQAAAQPIVWLPNPVTLENFAAVLTSGNLPRWYANSVVTSLIITAATLILSAMAAYAFSQLTFPGRNALFWFSLAGFMLPFEALLVPLYKLMNNLHAINTLAGIILPQLVSPIAIFVFRQFFDQIPKEFREAAVMDGATELRIMWSVFVPLSANIIWALAIVTFIGAWNNFLWPFIVVNSTEQMTIPVGLTQVQSAYGLRYAQTMAVAILGGLPVILAYLLFQRRVTEGFLSASGLKG
ncbi:carbohydrate ABC transporter permease [Deinococcus sonorensis]|uniref:Carbohydrate ABC transporter permease n=2 Tax=Deinococcus sonorensis TaxID=309891 RepID=A0AAU7UCA1_9DEIO